MRLALPTVILIGWFILGMCVWQLVLAFREERRRRQYLNQMWVMYPRPWPEAHSTRPEWDSIIEKGEQHDDA